MTNRLSDILSKLPGIAMVNRPVDIWKSTLTTTTERVKGPAFEDPETVQTLHNLGRPATKPKGKKNDTPAA